MSSLALGVTRAIGPPLPSEYTVVHAHVVMRHGQRTRLIKTPAQEFGQNDGVVVRAQGGRTVGIRGGDEGWGGGRLEGAGRSSLSEWGALVRDSDPT